VTKPQVTALYLLPFGAILVLVTRPPRVGRDVLARRWRLHHRVRLRMDCRRMVVRQARGGHPVSALNVLVTVLVVVILVLLVMRLL
jgi:hypothetical protein